jgi:hypothetical protein
MVEDDRPIPMTTVFGGLALAGWLVACDLWLKVLARMGACVSSTDLAETLLAAWTVPDGCSALEIVPGATLEPGVRSASLLPIPLPEGAGQVWGLALFGMATVITIVVIRWQWRTRGDALALGTLWAGVLIHGSPRLLHEGTTFTELGLWGFSTGLGDVTLAWALLWLSWRLVAELRA